MIIDTRYYERCIQTLSKALKLLAEVNSDSIDYDLYRSASIKEFEIILELSGSLLRKVLKPYYHSAKEVDKLYFKDLFRHAVLRSLITQETSERWFKYRDNRNSTAHDYGVKFAEETLLLLPHFIQDARQLVDVVKKANDDFEKQK